MSDTHSLLRLLLWLSPSFPVGAFSYSHGLEAAVEAGLVRDPATTADWVRTLLRHGAGRTDAVLFLHAHRAAFKDEALARVTELADALRPTAELALESAAQGQAFVTAVAAAWPDPWWDAWRQRLRHGGRTPTYAVAVGVAAARAGIAADAALAAFLHAFAANLVSAAVRLVPLGQSDGLRAMAALEPDVLEAAAAAQTRTLDDLGSAVPVAEWCSIIHETQYTRLFRS
jgi:urease accessory protein